MSSVLSERRTDTTLPLFDPDAAAEQLVRAFDATAVQRDRDGGHAAAERQLIRDSGLLAFSVPRSAGGLGADWPTTCRVIRRLAQADSALAHVFAFHHLQVATVVLYGNAEQQQRLLRQTVAEDWFWGNALNPLDVRLYATSTGDGWRLDGVKSYASGSVGSDRLMLSAHVPRADGTGPALLIGQVATHSAGLEVREDWDSFGQRQTDSGTVQFKGVVLRRADVLQAPDTPPTPRATLRPLVSQLIMANVYLGLAIGAYEAARRYTQQEARPWFSAGVSRSADDPYVQHRYGQLWLLIRPAQLAADAAAAALQHALDRGHALSATERGATAVAMAEAKVLAHRAAMDVSSQMFELTGARSTSSRHGFDRYWRNARVHTLHDPVDQKLRDIGRYQLDARSPDPTPYS
ncbi:MAG: acyl-CoA dehydrogenase family protein [Burkholderiaceae bacterium]|nr:acyl-CoA dehydrogenase family protein [Burkholderiaceae bacterium]